MTVTFSSVIIPSVTIRSRIKTVLNIAARLADKDEERDRIGEIPPAPRIAGVLPS